MSKKVYLSPSNHGVNQNKCLHKGCYEDKHTRPMANACAKYLKASGIEVKIAAETTGVLNGARTKEANYWGADLYVPIHSNAASASARYLLFMCASTTGKYKALFDCVKPYFAKIYDGDIKLTRRTDLYEINTPIATTFYCEMGFHTNRKDCDQFIHNADAIGKALAQGICKYFGVTFKSTASTTGTTGTTTKKSYTGTFPTLPKRGYFQSGDKGVNVTRLQALLNWSMNAGLVTDGILGAKSVAAIKSFQKKYNLEVDGLFGKLCLSKAKTIKK